MYTIGSTSLEKEFQCNENFSLTALNDDTVKYSWIEVSQEWNLGQSIEDIPVRSPCPA